MPRALVIAGVAQHPRPGWPARAASSWSGRARAGERAFPDARTSVVLTAAMKGRPGFSSGCGAHDGDRFAPASISLRSMRFTRRTHSSLPLQVDARDGHQFVAHHKVGVSAPPRGRRLPGYADCALAGDHVIDARGKRSRPRRGPCRRDAPTRLRRMAGRSLVRGRHRPRGRKMLARTARSPPSASGADYGSPTTAGAAHLTIETPAFEQTRYSRSGPAAERCFAR